MNTRNFHLGDILSVTTGCLLSPRRMEGVYDILNFMTADNLFTHQLGRRGHLRCCGLPGHLCHVGDAMMKITMHPEQAKACIVLETPADIEKAALIFNRGVNCMSDRGRDVEHTTDVLNAAAKKIKGRKVLAHG